MRITKRQTALAAVSACMLFWGFSFVSIKIAVAVFGPMTLGAVRFAIAVVFLFILKRIKAPDEKISREEIPLLAGAGITGVTLYFFFENNGVALIPASEASIITAAIPVITLIIESMKRSFRDIVIPGIGALVSMTGVALVAGVSFALHGTAIGYLYLAGTCASWVAYCFLTRPLFDRHSRIFIVFWQSAIGFLGFLPFTFLEKSWRIFGTSAVSAPGAWVWGHVIFLGIFCSALGYWFYALSLEVLGVSSSAVFINFIPVVSAIAGYFILGERLLPLQILGAVLVLAGVYLAIAVPQIAQARSKKTNSAG